MKDKETKTAKPRRAGRASKAVEKPKKLPATNQRSFTAEILVKPSGKAAMDILWPDGTMMCVIVHDEVMKFPGLRGFLDNTKLSYKATLTVTALEEIPVRPVAGRPFNPAGSPLPPAGLPDESGDAVVDGDPPDLPEVDDV